MNPYRVPQGFEFIRVLGRGATGVVVLARQTSLSRLVAVKTIPTTVSTAAVERLRREARVLAGLHDRHILPVYQLHQDAASVSLVMKYEPWGDLSAVMSTLSGSQRTAVLDDVATGLGTAHAHGIVHRDLKPANILSDEYGRAVLADFGLARLPRRPDAFRTVGTTVTGTPLYLAPEQIEHPHLESAEIDWYAFGILAYQLLVGRWPYADPTWVSYEQAHRFAAPIAPLSIRPEIPPTVADTLLELLAKDPSRRSPPSALTEALRSWTVAEWDAFIPVGTADPGTMDSVRSGTRTRTGTEGVTGGVAAPFGAVAGVEECGLDVHREQDPAGSGKGSPPVDIPWIAPPAFQPRRRGMRAGRLVGVVVAGMLLGLLAYLIWLNL